MKRRYLVVMAALSPMLHPGAVRADVDDPLKLLVRYELVSDSNLFRQPAAGGSVPAGRSRSDRTGIASLGLVLDKSYSLQRIQLAASVVNYRYQNFDYLSFTGLNYDANWSWSVTPRVRGNLIANRREVSNSFSDVRNTNQRNIRTDDSLRLEGEADLGAAVRLLGGADQMRTVNEELLIQEKNTRTETVFAGVRYVVPSGSAISYRLRQGRGRYSDGDTDLGATLPSTFDQTEHEVRADWTLSGKTSLGARLAYLDRRHSDLPQRDFAEPIGELRMRWNATAKLGLDAVVAREVRAYQTPYSSYWIGKRFILAPSWRATAHTSVRLRVDRLVQDYEGGLAQASALGERHDTTNTALIGIDWRPRDSLWFSVWLQTQKRSSSFTGFDFKNNSASVAAQLTF